MSNLFSVGMMITSNWYAHMSTRNTVSCMAQGEAVGTAAALCAAEGVTPRQLDRALLHRTLADHGVYFGE